jgi:hypothetical protein
MDILIVEDKRGWLRRLSAAKPINLQSFLEPDILDCGRGP